MIAAVRIERGAQIAVIVIDHPPVNTLSHAVPGIWTCCGAGQIGSPTLMSTCRRSVARDSSPPKVTRTHCNDRRLE